MADLAKAKMLLKKLRNGGDVSMRDLESALGKEGIADYENLWQYELDKRSQFETKPSEIKHYEELVRDADFDNNRAEGIKKSGKRSIKDIGGRNSRVRLRDASETKYERAAEYLSEIIGNDDNLRVWFDRDLDFGADTTTISIDPVGIPRTVTSRSVHKRSTGLAEKRSKADVKKDVLENAIAGMEREAEREAAIRKMLKDEQSGSIEGQIGCTKEGKTVN